MTNESKFSAPNWIQPELFEKLLEENVDNFKSIKEFTVKPGIGAGENYATVMLKVEIEVELKDLSTKPLSFMLKVSHENEHLSEMMKSHDIFDVEKGMYEDIVPAFEKLYAEAGVEVNFGPKSFTLPVQQKYIMLENLCPRGFKNANRLEGLDMEHTKWVLKKLAQWHAASTVLVATKGPFEKKYLDCYIKEENKLIIEKMHQAIGQIFLSCAKNYSNFEEYKDNLISIDTNYVHEIFKAAQRDPNEFNVLNHGDCWSNNVMFQYNDEGEIIETYLIDYQIPRYGSPAQDLYYFLISSTKYEIKIKEFDFFMRFYHDNLVESLKILNYKKKIPLLRDLYKMMFRYGIWGYATAAGVMGAVLLDPTDTANIENFISDSDSGLAFKKLMYSNNRYRKHIEALLSWLQNRGALCCSL